MSGFLRLGRSAAFGVEVLSAFLILSQEPICLGDQFSEHL